MLIIWFILQNRVISTGTSAMDLTVPFDETAVLMDNLAYLVKAVGVSIIVIYFTLLTY